MITDPPVAARIRLDELQMQLVDGSKPLSGRLEVLHDEEWHSICVEGFTENYAQHVVSTIKSVIKFVYGNYTSFMQGKRSIIT